MTAQMMSTLHSSSHGQLPPELMQGVKQALLASFSTICGAEPVHLETQEEVPRCDGIVGIISFVGTLSWSLMLGLPRETASAMALQFAGFEIEFDSPDMGDVVGELANVMAGQVTVQMEKMGIRAEMSLPTVARGSDVEMLLPGYLPSARMYFDSAPGKFWVKITAANHN